MKCEYILCRHLQWQNFNYIFFIVNGTNTKRRIEWKAMQRKLGWWNWFAYFSLFWRKNVNAAVVVDKSFALYKLIIFTSNFPFILYNFHSHFVRFFLKYLYHRIRPERNNLTMERHKGKRTFWIAGKKKTNKNTKSKEDVEITLLNRIFILNKLSNAKLFAASYRFFCSVFVFHLSRCPSRIQTELDNEVASSFKVGGRMLLMIIVNNWRAD